MSTVGSRSSSASPLASTDKQSVMELSQEQLEELVESPIALEHFIDHLEVVINSRTLKREWWLGIDNVVRLAICCYEKEFVKLRSVASESD
ncbi:hypothetical protein BG011_007609 [Mortierella polycephala]|uniref:Uncharacterized protein n=1 Tax=Mortierella polycephala TaxID=41804 RepID=A0A9P6PRY4_9FUNG|nr:hypothetical protein BG011_007609 [Mortierella polycephala]